MRSTKIPGVFKENNKLFTLNPDECRGRRVYNESLVVRNGREYRSWNPYRSKLAAALLNRADFKVDFSFKFLYLGAATGTTLSHVSDILKDGIVFAVEISPVAVKKLIQICQKRKNIVPILEDAAHPERYSHIVDQVDVIYQDIAQKNQAEIFIQNVVRYLKKNGYGYMMVKARSIDVSQKPEKIYRWVISYLRGNGLRILNVVNLTPYEKDHALIITSS